MGQEFFFIFLLLLFLRNFLGYVSSGKPEQLIWNPNFTCKPYGGIPLRFTSSSASTPVLSTGRVPVLGWIVLLALAVHGPLLLMQLPAGAFDANIHMFFADHYAHHWFNPWNEKWYAGFSQTTYPPLTHQLVALFSHVFGLTMSYMFIQGLVVLLLPIGMYRFARLWVDERAATYAAIGTIFIGSLWGMVYQAGQLPTTFASVLTLNALPFFYGWIREGRFSSLVKGLALVLVGAAAHHVTMIFGTFFFALPVIWLAFIDRKQEGADSSLGGVLSRTLVFAAIAVIGMLIVLLPYWIELYHNPLKQAAIYHQSRDNYILEGHSGLNFWVIPQGTLILAMPFIFWYGARERRVRPLFFGWYLTTLISLGGTTPLPKWLFGRAYEILTYERFTYWSTLMALPIVGVLAVKLINRYRMKAAVALSIAAVASSAIVLSWLHYNPITASPFNIDEVVNFLNRDNHAKFRYLLLGFGNDFSRVCTLAEASSVDGDYHSARLLPELTEHGSGKLSDAKYFGANGMEALRAMLKHANRYGLKYVFVRDPYYHPMLAFAGWRLAETYDNGNVTLWSKEDIAPAHKITPPPGAMPNQVECILWGILPISTIVLALGVLIAFPERRRIPETVDFPETTTEPVALREAK